MEWCPKTPLPSVSRGLHNMSVEERNQVLDALNEDIFYAQTQCILYGRKVRMDLQLYRVDDQSYLVDFRNVGYLMSQPEAPASAAAASAAFDSSVETTMAPAASLASVPPAHRHCLHRPSRSVATPKVRFFSSMRCFVSLWS